MNKPIDANSVMQMMSGPVRIGVDIEPFQGADGMPDEAAKAIHAAADVGSRINALERLPALRAHASAFGVSDDRLLEWIAALAVIEEEPDGHPLMSALIPAGSDNGLRMTMTKARHICAAGRIIAESWEAQARKAPPAEAPANTTGGDDHGDKPARGFFKASVWFAKAQALAKRRDDHQGDGDPVAAYAAEHDLKPSYVNQILTAHADLERLRLTRPDLAKGLETQPYGIIVSYVGWRSGDEQEAARQAQAVVDGTMTPSAYREASRASGALSARKQRAEGILPPKRRSRGKPHAGQPQLQLGESAKGTDTAPAPKTTEPEAHARVCATPPASGDYGFAALEAIASNAFPAGTPWAPSADGDGEPVIEADGRQVAAIVMPRGLAETDYAQMRKLAAWRASAKERAGSATYVAMPWEADPVSMREALTALDLRDAHVIPMEEVTLHRGGRPL